MKNSKIAMRERDTIAARALPMLMAVVTASLLPGGGHAMSTQTRTSAFDYEVATGLLKKEVIEPGNSTSCVVTEYTLDDYGRHRAVTTRNCNGSAGMAPGAVTEAAAPGAPAAFAARGASITFTADQRFVATSTNALGHTEAKAYDGRFGTVTSLTGPNNLTTQWAHDDFGRKVLEKRADGHGTRWTYEYCSGLAGGTLLCPTIAGAAGAYAVTSIAVSAPIDLAARTTGPVVGPYSRTYFDTLNRAIRIETQSADFDGTSALVYQDIEYNELGQVARRSNPYSYGQTPYWTSYVYDLLGRVTSVNAPTDTAPSGAITSTVYNGLTVEVTDPNNNKTTHVYNVARQLVTVIDAKGNSHHKAYDPQGSLVRAADAAGNVSSIVYDTRGRKIESYDPDMGVWRYGYNALGELVTQTDAKGQSTTLAYDLLGRLTRRAYAGLISNWYYDAQADGSACSMGLGKLCEEVSDNGHAVRHVFDALGRPSSTTTTVLGASYTASVSYDSMGRIDVRTYPSGLALRNSYTALGFLRSVIDGRTSSALWTANSANPAGSLLQYTYGNGVVSTNGYYPGTNRLHTLQAGPGSAVQNITHSYDPTGRLATRVDNVTSVSAAYDYDEIDRVSRETRFGGGVSGSQVTSWTYDAIGNIRTRTEGGVVQTYSYYPSGANSRLPHAVMSVDGTVNAVPAPSYGYDGNGNLTAGAGRTVTWTAFNKVEAVTRGTSRLEYVYGTSLERAQERHYLNGSLQRTTTYLNPGAGAGLYYEEETGVAGTKRKHYVTAGGATIAMITCTATPCTNTANTTIQYWHKDHLGSTSVVTDAAGAVVERLAYEPFGKRRYGNGVTDAEGTLVSSSTDRGYTEHEHMDEVGLVNMNGRIYDAGLGRFLSADPHVQFPDNAQSLNRYSYCLNDPLTCTDPTGYFSLGGWIEAHARLSLRPDVRSWVKWQRSQPGQAAVDRYIMSHSWANSVGRAVATYFTAWCGGCGGYAWTMYYTYQATGSLNAAHKAAAISYAANWASGQVGDFTEYVSDAGASYVAAQAVNTAGHALVGCAVGAATRTGCGAQAAAGAFQSLVAPHVPEGLEGMAVTMIAGGVGSDLAGGKFWDGALTAAMGYLFNQMQHGGRGNGQGPQQPGWGYEYPDVDHPFAPTAEFKARFFGSEEERLVWFRTQEIASGSAEAREWMKFSDPKAQLPRSGGPLYQIFDLGLDKAGVVRIAYSSKFPNVFYVSLDHYNPTPAQPLRWTRFEAAPPKN